jgi:Recombination endonuclease VII
VKHKRKGREQDYQKEWRSENKDKVRAYTYKRKYGITEEERDALLEKQGFVCAICGSDSPGIKGRGWHTDHCHETGQVRGMLCCHCNVGLGMFKDSPAHLTSAINYLRINHGDTLCN